MSSWPGRAGPPRSRARSATAGGQAAAGAAAGDDEARRVDAELVGVLGGPGQAGVAVLDRARVRASRAPAGTPPTPRPPELLGPARAAAACAAAVVADDHAAAVDVVQAATGAGAGRPADQQRDLGRPAGRAPSRSVTSNAPPRRSSSSDRRGSTGLGCRRTGIRSGVTDEGRCWVITAKAAASSASKGGRRPQGAVGELFGMVVVNVASRYRGAAAGSPLPFHRGAIGARGPARDGGFSAPGSARGSSRRTGCRDGPGCSPVCLTGVTSTARARQ